MIPGQRWTSARLRRTESDIIIYVTCIECGVIVKVHVWVTSKCCHTLDGCPGLRRKTEMPIVAALPQILQDSFEYFGEKSKIFR